MPSNNSPDVSHTWNCCYCLFIDLSHYYPWQIFGKYNRMHMKLLSCEYNRAPFMISTLLWVMDWCHQTSHHITWSNVALDLRHHMALLGHNKLKFMSPFPVQLTDCRLNLWSVSIPGKLTNFLVQSMPLVWCKIPIYSIPIYQARH